MIRNSTRTTAFTREELHQLFTLNSETGELIWKIARAGCIRVETSAGGLSANGRVYIRLLGRHYLRSRLVYQYVHGDILPDEVVHINGNPQDDRPENLCPVFRHPDKVLTQGYLHATYDLDEETGGLTRKVEAQNRVDLIGKPIAYRINGRVYVSVLGRKMPKYHLVYMYVHGYIPEQIIHRNGNLSDDRPENLLAATMSQKAWNKGPHRGRELPKGVHVRPEKQKRGKPYSARIMKDGKRYYLGSFETAEEAAEAYDGAARSLFGEYARTNNL